MSETKPVYRIVQRTHINRWDNQLQQAVPGWDVRALWLSTGTLLPVFVPDDAYTAENLDALIREAGAKDEQIEGLSS